MTALDVVLLAVAIVPALVIAHALLSYRGRRIPLARLVTARREVVRRG